MRSLGCLDFVSTKSVNILEELVTNYEVTEGNNKHERGMSSSIKLERIHGSKSWRTFFFERVIPLVTVCERAEHKGREPCSEDITPITKVNISTTTELEKLADIVEDRKMWKEDKE